MHSPNPFIGRPLLIWEGLASRRPTGRCQNGYGRNPGFGSHAGQEFDLLVDWRPKAWGQVRAGFGHFFVGEYIRQSINSVPANGGAVDANWLYMQVSVDF